MSGPNDFRLNHGDKWYSCCLCGQVYLFVDLWFENGSVEPQYGEVLTGASTKCTGVVAIVDLCSGSWADGDAAGSILMANPTGYRWPNDICFDQGESISGSLGAVLAASEDGLLKRSGRMWKLGDIVTSPLDGRDYCPDHYRIHVKKRMIDRTKSSDVSDLEIDEVPDREVGYLS